MRIEDRELRAMALIIKALNLCSWSWEVRLRILRWAVERNLGGHYRITKESE